MKKSKDARVASRRRAVAVLAMFVMAFAACATDDRERRRVEPVAESGLHVSPPGVIGAVGGARLSHDGLVALTVCATNENGYIESLSVPPQCTVNWMPPSGWRLVTFAAPGCNPVICVIDPSF